MRRINTAVLVVTALLLTAGCISEDKEKTTQEAVRKIEEASAGKDYQRMMFLADSLNKVGDLSDGDSYYWQGFAYYRQKQTRLAEFYWKESLKSTQSAIDPGDLNTYARSASYLTGLYIRYLNFASATYVSFEALRKLDAAKSDTTSDYTNLLIFAGCCNAHFAASDSVVNSLFERAFQRHIDNISANPSKKAYRDAVVGIINISYCWLSVKRYEQGILWTERLGQLVANYKNLYPDDEDYIDKQWARYRIFQAIGLGGIGKMDEASEAYASFERTHFSKTTEGLVDASDYLSMAGRYKEAASSLRNLDQVMSSEQAFFSLEDLQKYMLKKYWAYYLSDQRDSANVIAHQICERLDSAIVRSHNIDSEGLETLRQKEEQIRQQQQHIANGYILSLVCALALLSIFFGFYHVYRNHAQRKLAKAHAKLKDAYEKLEETTTAKERMESELRIARDIQMSMLPTHYPNYPGLDMYALMDPAKEVGGDLYGFMLNEERQQLYFCVGDVSGKGVPASLFMSQTTRLFNQMATYGACPTEICNQLNKALSGEDNTNGMFVTMFVCRLNLNLHLLEYCNAGHNPPVLGNADGQFSFLEMESNAPIGLWPDLEFVGEEIPYFSNRFMLLYTDGLNEAENALQEQFGDDRLLATLRESQYESARSVVETLAAKVEAHRDGTPPNDDLTMLCLKLSI